MKPGSPIPTILAAGVALAALAVYLWQPESETPTDSAFLVPTPVAPPTLPLPDFRTEAVSESSSEPVTKAVSVSAHPTVAARPVPIGNTHSSFGGKATPPIEIRVAVARLQTLPNRHREVSVQRSSAAGIPKTPVAEARVLFSAISAVLSAPKAVPANESAEIAMPAALPAALIEPDPAKPLPQEHREIIRNLQEDFIKEIGGPGQDVNDPTYLSKWRRAQTESDERFRGLFGQQAFLERERIANLAGDRAPSQ